MINVNDLSPLKFSGKIYTVNNDSIENTVKPKRKGRNAEINLAFNIITKSAVRHSVHLIEVKHVQDVLGRSLWFISTLEQFRKYAPEIFDLMSKSNNSHDKSNKELNSFLALYNPSKTLPMKYAIRKKYYENTNVLIDTDKCIVIMFTSKKYAMGLMEAIYHNVYHVNGTNKYTLYFKDGSTASYRSACINISDDQIKKLSFYTKNKPNDRFVWFDSIKNWIQKKPYKTMEV